MKTLKASYWLLTLLRIHFTSFISNIGIWKYGYFSGFIIYFLNFIQYKRCITWSLWSIDRGQRIDHISKQHCPSISATNLCSNAQIPSQWCPIFIVFSPGQLPSLCLRQYHLVKNWWCNGLNETNWGLT